MCVSLESTTAPERSRAQTRQRLLDAGTELFARRGVHGVTTHAIAGAAGVAAGTFYLHFKDKRALFREIVGGAVEELRTRLQRATAAPDLAAAVRGRSLELCRFAEEQREVVQILFGRGAGDPELAGDILDDFATALTASADEQIAAGVYDRSLDPAVTAQALVGMLARVVTWWSEDPTRAPRERVIETLTRIQLDGLRP